jgi:hypothetical protein
MLWLNYPDPSRVGGCKFVNVSPAVGTNDGGWGWGGKFCDFNDDGLVDIFALNGFTTGADPNKTYWYQLQDMVTQTKNNASDTRVWPEMNDRDLSGYEPSRLFLQLPSGAGNTQRKQSGQAPAAGRYPDPPHFREMAMGCGITDLYNGRGVALCDVDNDGDIDMYVANQGATSCLYRNEMFTGDRASREEAHWVGLSLIGDPGEAFAIGGRTHASTRDAIGSRVEVWEKGIRRVRELTYYNGFASQSEKRMNVGIGSAAVIDSIVVNWQSGRREIFNGADFPIDRYYTIEEARINGELIARHK